ncbi:MAG: TetR/AcrR family transcriptional regulator [Chloroflexota bacterium]
MSTPLITDKRIRRTHRLLREAFIELIAEQGYNSLRVEDILQRADIGRTTFYAHFKDKRALLENVADIFDSKYQADLAQRSLDENGNIPLVAVQKVFESFERNAPFFGMVLESRDVPILYERVQEAFRDVFTRLLEEQTQFLKLTPAVPVSILAEFYVGALLAMGKWWLSNNMRPYTAAEMAKMFYELDQHGRLEVMSRE